VFRGLTVLLTITALLSWPAPPPAAPLKPVVTTYFGHRVVDRYRYLERLNDPAVQKYFRQQADYTNAVLARLGSGREKIRADVARLSDAGASVSTIFRAGNRVFYLERPPGANDARLMMLDPGSAPRLLLDPDALAKSTGSKAHLSLSTVLPSPDGAYVAVGIVPGGAEVETHTRIVDAASGSLLPEDIPRTWFGATAWAPDGKTLFYNQLPQLKPGQSQNDRELRSIVYRHTVGGTSADPAVFGIGLDPHVSFVPTDGPYVGISPASSYAIGVNSHGVQNELTLYVAPVAALTASGSIPWRKIADVSDAVTGFDVNGSTLYLQSHKNASRYKVTTIDLSDTGQTAANATTIVPTSEIVIQQIAVAQDGLYVRGILGGIANLRRVPLAASGASSAVSEVKLPFAGTLQEFTTDPRVPGALIGLVSWTKPLLVYALDANGALADTGIVKLPKIDTSLYTSIEVKSRSEDGTLVPLSIVMRRGAKLDGSNPAYLEAYGAYALDIDPYFLRTQLAWLDQGGIYAVSHVRGGGEYGEDWHLAGKDALKHHTFDDAVGAARYLIDNKYTSAAHLAIEGTSAGGIMVGGAITRHPELFAAALDVVGWTDPLRSEAADPNGTTNVPEFGSVSTKAGFSALSMMDAYHHIVDGRKYPAVLAVTGINDPRVAPWHPAKFVARLQQASASGRPVLLRVDYDAGHGLLAASRAQRISLLTDEFSFLLWQCGSPLFSGIPTNIRSMSPAK
jgi:prolyl oligopeptidase